MSEQRAITSNIDLLLDTLPPRIQTAIDAAPESKDNLIEIVLDLGRMAEARYTTVERLLTDSEVSQDDIDYVIARIGMFGEDNRAGIPRTLHRISAIRNRAGKVIGLTCRVGRAVFGTIAILRDLIESGKSVLLLGRPGVGKTTLLRETARVLADDLRKRVVIVDTSNEIAGDGDIPHPGIGRARRMQVQRPSEQHAVMIEAVENHMPEVIVIDEIGTELEAQAARTIAERGVQLIGTAHGNTLDNLMINPTLSDLIGGIQAVTLGDEEARRRGTQKTVLERKAPPTFDVMVEIQSRDQMLVYPEVSTAVDSLLRAEDPMAELRTRNPDGQIVTERVGRPPREGEDAVQPYSRRPGNGRDRSNGGGGGGGREPNGGGGRESNGAGGRERNGGGRGGRERSYAAVPMNEGEELLAAMQQRLAPTPQRSSAGPQRIFPFGVSRDRLERAIASMHVPATIVREMSEATMVMTLKNYYRQGAERVRQAEDRGVPVYVLRNNTITQMERQLADVFQVVVPDTETQEEPSGEDESAARMETEQAITQLLNGERKSVDLAPRGNFVRKLQHQMAERYNVRSQSHGREPHRRVKIFR